MSSYYKLAFGLIIALSVAAFLGAMVPAHPFCEQLPPGFKPTKVESSRLGFPGSWDRPKNLPNNILVLRVQFSDVKFATTAQYPDFLVHDEEFFDRWMIHLSDFFNDASHGAYNLHYTLHPDVFTLPQTMAYYGADSEDTTDARLKEFFQTTMQMADQAIDFSRFGGLIIFHAGAGQESDINGIRREEIWSTFLTRARLQYWFDEDNDDYQGYPADGVHLTNIVIVPEHEYQDYFPGEGENDADVYLFSIYGVLCHQFGHILGLPSLFDNDSSNGSSQGIGNWGLMGTGIWNASGYVPAQVSAWSRVFLGWENPIVVTSDAENLPVEHFLNHTLVDNRVYKIPISDAEYFLIENRQQNPDGSVDPYNGLPSYTFALLPDGEQDYYENYPELPFFNFMKNRYKGSEWDFMLPGLGGPIPIGLNVPVDGSGLLIWHIDENVIAQNFTTNFDLNTINADASHKGVDLEEADGIQHLDTAAADQYKYGGPFDSFRAGNNDYFGQLIHNGMLSLPTAESYYGGIPLEIYDISESGNTMSFSVRFGWSLSTGYGGPNPINACVVDFDGDGKLELVYPQPDGQIHIWKDEQPLPGFPISRMPMEHTYVWTGSEFYFPMQVGTTARLYKLDSSGGEYLPNFAGKTWATHPVSTGESLFMAFNDSSNGKGSLHKYDLYSMQLQEIATFEGTIATNMAWLDNSLFIPWRQDEQFYVSEFKGGFSDRLLDVPADSTLVGIFVAPVNPQADSGEPNLIVQCLNSIYIFDSEDQILPGFPYVHDMNTTAPLTIADWDQNGTLDLLISSDRGVAVIDYAGSLVSPVPLALAASDSLAFNAGVLVADIDNDGKNEILGAFSHNRLICWEDNFRYKPGFPVSFGNRSRNLPIISEGSDGQIYVWLACDDGTVHRQVLPDIDLNGLKPGWDTEYGNLQRTASRGLAGLTNQYETAELFVPGELYIFPNPLKSIYDQKLTLNVMTSRDAQLEVRIFDIKGNLIHSQNGQAKAYLRNRDLISIPAEKLGSGVYITVVSDGKQSRSIKFAVEK